MGWESRHEHLSTQTNVYARRFLVSLQIKKAEISLTCCFGWIRLKNKKQKKIKTQVKENAYGFKQLKEEENYKQKETEVIK